MNISLHGNQTHRPDNWHGERSRLLQRWPKWFEDLTEKHEPFFFFFWASQTWFYALKMMKTADGCSEHNRYQMKSALLFSLFSFHPLWTGVFGSSTFWQQLQQLISLACNTDLLPRLLCFCKQQYNANRTVAARSQTCPTTELLSIKLRYQLFEWDKYESW